MTANFSGDPCCDNFAGDLGATVGDLDSGGGGEVADSGVPQLGPLLHGTRLMGPAEPSSVVPPPLLIERDGSVLAGG